jgi:hypothetical protein
MAALMVIFILLGVPIAMLSEASRFADASHCTTLNTLQYSRQINCNHCILPSICMNTAQISPASFGDFGCFPWISGLQVGFLPRFLASIDHRMLAIWLDFFIVALIPDLNVTVSQFTFIEK